MLGGHGDKAFLLITMLSIGYVAVSQNKGNPNIDPNIL